MGDLISLDQDKDNQFERKSHGAFIVDGIEIASTLQCPHCNMHFVSKRGSGHRRAWCPKCNAVTCGKESCDPCVPFEKRIELCEKIPGLTVDDVPMYLILHPEIKVSVL